MRITNRGWWVIAITLVVSALFIGSVLPARGIG